MKVERCIFMVFSILMKCPLQFLQGGHTVLCIVHGLSACYSVHLSFLQSHIKTFMIRAAQVCVNLTIINSKLQSYQISLLYHLSNLLNLKLKQVMIFRLLKTKFIPNTYTHNQSSDLNRKYSTVLNKMTRDLLIRISITMTNSA